MADDPYNNTLDWKLPLVALCVWFAHFMTAWSLSVILIDGMPLLWATIMLSLGALTLLTVLFARHRAGARQPLTALAISLSGLAVLFVTAQLILA